MKTSKTFDIFLLIIGLILLNGSVVFLSFFVSIWFLLLFIPYSLIDILLIVIIKMITDKYN